MPQRASKFPLLIIDTASRRPWVGLKIEADTLEWVASENEPSSALFESIKALNARGTLRFEEIQTIAYNEGPGSMLGIRTATMALRSWTSAKILRKVNFLAYDSLTIGAHILEKGGLSEKACVVTDARRNSWNALEVETNKVNRPILVANETLEASTTTCYLLDEFPRWTKSEINFAALPYRPETAFSDGSFIPKLRSVDLPQPVVLREAEYQKWNPSFKPKDPS